MAGDPSSSAPKRHVIADPYPETIGVSALTIFAPENFRGDAKIIWWYPGHDRDEDKRCMTCSCSWLLQGVFHDVQGHKLFHQKELFDARVVALVLHAFYRVRIEAAARLEAAYQWQAYPLDWRTSK